MNRKPFLLLGVFALILLVLGGLVGYRLGQRRQSGGTMTATPNANCVDFHDAGPHSGEVGCVAGRILRVYTSRGGNTFLDFCPDYRTCPFTSVIFSSDRGKFGKLETLEGRSVEIRGAITTYEGRAEVIIRDPEQIRVVP